MSLHTLHLRSENPDLLVEFELPPGTHGRIGASPKAEITLPLGGIPPLLGIVGRFHDGRLYLADLEGAITQRLDLPGRLDLPPYQFEIFQPEAVGATLAAPGTGWEERYVAGNMPWEKGQAAPPLLELLTGEVPVEWGCGPILVPGCGFGHDVRALAELGVPVVGVDLAPTAVVQARSFPRTADESYELADFMHPAWLAGRKFSAVWEHTCFCAIQPVDRGRYVEAVANCLAAGGLLVGVFFINPFDPGEEREGPPFGTTVAELGTWFDPWFVQEHGWVPRQAHAGREGREWIGIFRRKA